MRGPRRACRRASAGRRDERVERLVRAVGVVGGLEARRQLEVVLGQEGEQVADVLEALLLVLGGEVADAGLRVVGHRAAELLELDLLAGDRLDHVGAGDEHVPGLLDHEDEVGHRRRVDGAAGARAHDQADLRDHPRALDVADEDVAVAAERDDPLLDPRPARVVDPDHRRADLGGEVHDLEHLLGHHLAERAAEDGEVLAEDDDRPAVDRAVAGHDRVAVGPLLVHPELVAAVADEAVELLEGAGIEQLLDPLARGQLALRVLLLDRGLGGGMDRRSRSSRSCASFSSWVSGVASRTGAGFYGGRRDASAGVDQWPSQIREADHLSRERVGAIENCGPRRVVALVLPFDRRP